MGFTDKVMDGFKKADEKLGNAVDNGKLDMDISKEETKIKDNTKEIGNKMVAYFDAGNTFDNAEIMALYDAIVESRKKVEELKAQKQ